MFDFIEGLEAGTGLVAAVAALVSIATLAVSGYKNRSQSQESRLNGVWRLREIDFSNLSPETQLSIEKTLTFVYAHIIPARSYLVLRQAEDVDTAVRHYPGVSRFVELTEKGDRFRYRPIPLLYDRDTRRVPVWRVLLAYGVACGVLASLGVVTLLAAVVASSNSQWTWVLAFSSAAFVCLILCVRSGRIGWKYENSCSEFAKAASGLVETRESSG